MILRPPGVTPTLLDASWSWLFANTRLSERGYGRGELTEEILQCAERCICKFYCAPSADTCDKARVRFVCSCLVHEIYLLHWMLKVPHHGHSLLRPSLEQITRRSSLSFRNGIVECPFFQAFLHCRQYESMQRKDIIHLCTRLFKSMLQLQKGWHGMHRIGLLFV